MTYNRVMTTEHGNLPTPEQWQPTNRLELMANFGQFLMQHGERGNRVDPVTLDHSSDPTYTLDDFEGAAWRARESFGANTDQIHKVIASYAVAPIRAENGHEELGLTIVGIDETDRQTTIHDYRAMSIGGDVQGEYALAKVPMNGTQAERLLAQTRPVESRHLVATDFSFLQRLLQELRSAWE